MGNPKLQLVDIKSLPEEEQKEKEKNAHVYRVENKFDPYEIRDCFNQYITDKLSEIPDLSESHFYNNKKLIIGFLITVIVIASHFFPIPWPQNYYFLIGCIIFYYIFTHIYASYEQNTEGNCFFLFEFDGKLFRFCSDMEDYSLEMQFLIQSVDKKNKENPNTTLYEGKIQVNEYVDARGYLCESKMFKSVNQWLNKANSELNKKTQ